LLGIQVRWPWNAESVRVYRVSLLRMKPEKVD
jgi:hypothetical protein